MGLFDFFKKKDKIETQLEKKFYPLSVAKVVRQTENAISVYFDIPKALQKTFEYKAGQYVTLRTKKDANQVLRSYSLSSCPTTDEFFRIAIKRKNGGILSGHLIDTLKADDVLEVFPPLGTFTPNLKAKTTAYFLYAGGSGITPMISIAKTLLSEKKNANITLIYANRSWETVIYLKELDDLAKKYTGRFEIKHIIDEPRGMRKSYKGIFQSKDYANLIGSNYTNTFAKGEHFICGPTPMMQAVETALKNVLKVENDKVHIEYFDMDKQAKQTTNLHIEQKNAAKKLDNQAVVAEIILNGETKIINIPAGETVLESCLDAGLDAPYMCEAGVCSTCRAMLSEGEVTMDATHALTENELKEGYILTCQAKAKSKKLVVNFDF